eukprot:TRINITY_DN5248_c0_g1_i1.p1 TRINITY_DN5248_c0_g1~~TRINITY_DN5248_c0_g1_i1.p1  ORF type:complete len:641 (-),score=164.92 TRINITY_DN5248_c0_g1_i1:245-2167(-)
MEEFEELISEDKLLEVAGAASLDQITKLSIKIDTSDQSAAKLGELLPNIKELRLSGSKLSTFRDLGTSLKHLKILFLSQSGVKDLDGIGALEGLEELYLPFNDISDLTPLMMHENLQVLDLEGNLIEKVEQLEILGTCEALYSLNLESNPITKEPDYRHEVCGLLSSLEVLDDEDITDEDKKDSLLSMVAPMSPQKRSQKDVSDETIMVIEGLKYANPEGPSSADVISTDSSNKNDSSSLTHGNSTVFAGSAVRALRSRSKPKPHVAIDPKLSHRDMVLAELRAFKLQMDEGTFRPKTPSAISRRPATAMLSHSKSSIAFVSSSAAHLSTANSSSFHSFGHLNKSEFDSFFGEDNNSDEDLTADVVGINRINNRPIIRDERIQHLSINTTTVDSPRRGKHLTRRPMSAFSTSPPKASTAYVPKLDLHGLPDDQESGPCYGGSNADSPVKMATIKPRPPLRPATSLPMRRLGHSSTMGVLRPSAFQIPSPLSSPPLTPQSPSRPFFNDRPPLPSKHSTSEHSIPIPRKKPSTPSSTNNSEGIIPSNRLPPRSPSKARISHGFVGSAVEANDNELITLLKMRPKDTPILKSKHSFQRYFAGIEETRMRRLLEDAYHNASTSREDTEARIQRRLKLMKGLFRK